MAMAASASDQTGAGKRPSILASRTASGSGSSCTALPAVRWHRSSTRRSRALSTASTNLTAKRQTVGGWLDYGIEEIIKPEREATTYAAYETFSRLHIKPYLGQIALDKLQPEELERWLRELDRRGVGVRTRQCCLSRLRTALTLALRRGYVVRNVAELVDPPASIRKKHQAPKMDDLKRLLDATREDRLHAMILVALGLGLRRGEVLGLKWEDIDF